MFTGRAVILLHLSLCLIHPMRGTRIISKSEQLATPPPFLLSWHTQCSNVFIFNSKKIVFYVLAPADPISLPPTLLEITRHNQNDDLLKSKSPRCTTALQVTAAASCEHPFLLCKHRTHTDSPHLVTLAFTQFQLTHTSHPPQAPNISWLSFSSSPYHTRHPHFHASLVSYGGRRRRERAGWW